MTDDGQTFSSDEAVLPALPGGQPRLQRDDKAGKWERVLECVFWREKSVRFGAYSTFQCAHCVQIFSVHRAGEESHFTDYGNNYLLFHGAPTVSMAGILCMIIITPLCLTQLNKKSMRTL